MSKVQVTKAIPRDLNRFLCYVADLIRSGSEKASLPSDDLIQDECATGGLCDDESGTYSFTYFPEPDVVTKWELLLSARQILAVSEGRLSELHLWRCQTPRCPNLFGSEEGYCSYCAFWVGENMVRPGADDEATCASVEEWLRLFAQLNPRATGLYAFTAYISTPGLERRLGQFPLEVMHRERPVG